VNGTPEQGWPRWMMDHLDQAAFVLVICTETYYRRFRGHEEPGRGKGADWEGALITQEIYDAKSRTVKFVPVMLAPRQEGFIPEPLRGHTHYELTSEDRYQALYSFLMGRAGVEPSPLGTVKPVPKRIVAPLRFGSATAPPAPSPTMIGVPHRNPFFTGREELLSHLHQQLQKEGIFALAQAAIHGLGGIGKTQTAIEYAHRFGEHYRFVLWVVAEEKAAIRAAYASMARDLGLVGAEADQEAAVLAMKAWLSRHDGWLLIFDNADDPGLLRDYLPTVRTDGKVLLTSRASSFVKVGIKEPFKVETLGPEAAIKFLIERTGDDDQTAAGELARELGYLPLALEQAAAYIETVGGGCAGYLARYRRQGLALLKKGEPSTDYPKTVETTWTLSFAAVKEESPASAELLNAAAFLVPDSIPIEIFTLGGSELGEVLAKALDGAAADSLAFWEVLAPLERYSLVDRLPDDAFRLHRLTQQVVKDSLWDEGRRDWAERMICGLSAAYPSGKFETWGGCERLQPHVRVASELIRVYKLESAKVGWLLNQGGFYAWERGSFIEARLFMEQASEMCERILGSEHPNTLNSRSNLAAILKYQGDLAGARRLNEQILEILEHVQGAEHPDTLTSRNNLAETLRYQGDLARAGRLHKETLKSLERALGVEHPDTLLSKANLANVLYLLENLGGAKTLEEEVLEARERLLGSEHPDTSLAMWNLLLTVQRLGDTEAADQLISRLRWLLDRDEASIASAQQREIRQGLLDLLKRA
jgi:hypothetical protein